MSSFLESSGFILSFLIASLGFGMLFGERALYVFLILVLVGMVLTNTGKIISLLGRGFN